MQQLPPHVLNTLIFQRQFPRPRTLPFEELFGARPISMKNSPETRVSGGTQPESSSEAPLRTLKELGMTKSPLIVPSTFTRSLMYLESHNSDSVSLRLLLLM